MKACASGSFVELPNPLVEVVSLAPSERGHDVVAYLHSLAPESVEVTLSFPALPQTGPSGPDDAPRMLGDIAIAYETTRKEADDDQKPFDHHLSHLAVHGFLHLIGYDHEKDDDAEVMETLEQEILAQLGIPNPYADRDPDARRERMN